MFMFTVSNLEFAIGKTGRPKLINLLECRRRGGSNWNEVERV